MTTRTKFILTYVGGIVTGVLLTFILILLMAFIGNSSSMNNDITMFDEPQQEINAETLKVMQVLPDENALAITEGPEYGLVVLFLAEDGNVYYDDQEIVVPSNKRVMQVGTYRYPTRNETVKTVPVVRILDR